jgi:DNA (cytosine-5)-methyltransferase 1
LESEGYACGSVVLGAHSVGSPHIRQRLYWVANSESIRPQEHGKRELWRASRKQSETSGLADTSSKGLQRHWESGEQSMEERWEGTERHAWTSGTRDQRLVQSNSDGCEQRSVATTTSGHRYSTESASSWDNYRLANCRDGKSRRIPTEPAFQPLAHGIPARVVRLRGYGNAIVPQVAAEFVKAFIKS